uniref:Uncharacterized protein n=1 Tax=Anguilla anguilla TaxID=7936 RepID=A0A0E9UB06_ANGAN
MSFCFPINIFYLSFYEYHLFNYKMLFSVFREAKLILTP